MKKIFIRERDATSVVINEFEIIPSEKNRIGRSRLSVESEDERLLGFKVYNDNTIEIIEQKENDIENFEMKKKSNFLVKFPEEFDINEKFITSINKPYLYNGREFMSDKNVLKWGTITISILDPIGPSTSQKIFILLNEKIKNYEINDDKPMFEFNIITTDPTGAEVENWTIGVRNITRIDFGSCNNKSETPSKINLTIDPLYCHLNY